MSKKTINFAFGIHNHQPVGNFDYVLDDAYKDSYLPFLECLGRHPDIKAAIHYTGPLWDYYLKEKPEWIEILRNLVKAGQLEMLSGAYYEPILVNISDRDKVGQIRRLNRTVRRETGYRPRGMWCAERIWEPQLAKPISLSGIKYTILDEYHFRSNGLNEEEIFGYYVTEEQGHPLIVIPINYRLRYSIPSGEPEEVIEYLRKWASEEGDRLAVFADDGEKFGVWPKSHHIAWEGKWVERFFNLVEENSDWINMTTFSGYMDKYPPRGRIYLPTASYFEMSIWSLPLESRVKLQGITEDYKQQGKWDDYRNFLKGGFWRNFLVKYPESNMIQKKALFVSEKVHNMASADKEEAMKELYMAQCNCAYWHGLFGGIYLPHLRQAIQEHLIRAETLADDEKHKGQPFKKTIQLDINRDMQDEVIINTFNLNLGFTPHRGGALYELYYKPGEINFCDTLTRQKEAYHEGITEFKGKDGDKEVNVGEYLIYDKYRRNSFLDHFFSDCVDLDSFSRSEYIESGDFLTNPYEIFISEKDDKAVLTLSRKGVVKVDNDEFPVEIEKTFFVSEDGKSIRVQYWVINNSDKPLEIRFGCELDFSILSREMDLNFIYIEKTIEEEEGERIEIEKFALDSEGEHGKIGRISVQDGHRDVKIHIHTGEEEEASALWRFPIRTVSMSEDGPEVIYQSTVIMPMWDLELEPGDSWENDLEISFEDMEEEEDEEESEENVGEVEE